MKMFLLQRWCVCLLWCHFMSVLLRQMSKISEIARCQLWMMPFDAVKSWSELGFSAKRVPENPQ